MPKLPSERLRSLASSNKAKEFKQILETDLYPFLDRLPAAHQKTLLSILSNAGNKNEAEVLVGYDMRSDSISVGLRALVESVDSNWKQGWEEQGEMMCGLLGELCEWLPILWRVGVEMGVEHALVHKSLKFCLSTHCDLGNTNCRTEFSDIDTDYSDLEIKNATGKVVYCSVLSTEDTILWVWRELIISSIIHNPNDTVAKKIIADMKKLGLTAKMLERLDDETLVAPKKSAKGGTAEDKKMDWELEEKRELLQNAHWTSEMRAAAVKVKVLFS